MRKTKAIYGIFSPQGRKMKGIKTIEKDLYYKGKKIRIANFTETTAWKNWVDVEFYDEPGKWTIPGYKIEEKMKK